MGPQSSTVFPAGKKNLDDIQDWLYGPSGTRKQDYDTDCGTALAKVRGILTLFIIPQIALAIGVPTSSIGVRVRRFCGFVSGGGCRAGCCLRCRLICVWVRARKSRGLSGRLLSEVSSDVCVCVWVRVRRFRGWLSGRVLSEVCVEVRMICPAPEDTPPLNASNVAPPLSYISANVW